MSSAKKIVIAGGSGFLGRSVIDAYSDTSAKIIVLTRGADVKDKNISYIHWDAETLGNWCAALEGATAVINLVGRSVNCRYTEKNKKEIVESRVRSTRVIGEACKAAGKPPAVWINAGSVAIFGNSGDDIKNERSDPGEGFSPQVCKKWEAAFQDADTPHTRKVFLRIGLVLQKRGGLLKPFIRLARAGLGGRIGNGRQYISWIHEQDFTGVVAAAIDRPDFTGIIHCTSPLPVTNDYFMKLLRKLWGLPFGLPNFSPMIKAGAVFIGTEPELILSGRRVVSLRLEEKKFHFKFANIHQALNQLRYG